MADNQSRKRPSIQSIQMLRAVAALLVMSMHIFVFTGAVVGNSLWQQLAALSSAFGNSGVDLFFVISGLIMYIITKEADGNSISYAYKFTVHRIFRIYPLFWVTLIFSTVALGYSLEALYAPGAWKEWVLYLAPEKVHPVSWTLRYEVRFYLVVAILLAAARKNLDLAFIVWGVGQFIASSLYLSGIIEENYYNYVLMTEFSMGLVVGALITRKITFRPNAILYAALAWLIISSIIVYNHKGDIITPYRHLLYGIPAAMAAYSIVTLQRIGSIKPPAILCRIGDISYSIYLWHYPIILYLSARWIASGHAFFDGLIFAATVTALTLSVSVVSYIIIEKPCIRLGRLWTRSRAPIANGGKKECPIET